MNFDLPPRIINEHGKVRSVGFEMEFGGIDLDETARILLSLFSGRLIRENEYIYTLHTPLGPFRLEADSNFLKEKKYEKYFHALGMDDSSLAHGVEDIVSSLAGTLIPFEVVMPPLPIGARRTNSRGLA